MANKNCELLNRLISLHARSLPVYLSDAAPFSSSGQDHALDVLNMIAADHQLTVDRLAEAVADRGGAISQGAFPAAYTAYHDLSLGFLIERLVENQRSEIGVIEKVVAELSEDAEALSLAEESLGAAQGHLQSLEELTRAATAG